MKIKLPSRLALVRENRKLQKELKRLMDVAKLQERALVDNNNFIVLTLAEREELKAHLCMLYGGVLHSSPDLTTRMGYVKQNWDRQHQALAQQHGTDMVILRDMSCKKCGCSFKFCADWKLESLPCPNCSTVLKW
jgi:hypothetical protein